MKRELFRVRWLADRKERSVGVIFRLFGVDVALIGLGYANDWRLIDLRIPHNYGVYFQLLCVFFAVGILPDEAIYRSAE